MEFQRGRQLTCSEAEARTPEVLSFISQGAPDSLACDRGSREGFLFHGQGLERPLSPFHQLWHFGHIFHPSTKMEPYQVNKNKTTVESGAQRYGHFGD